MEWFGNLIGMQLFELVNYYPHSKSRIQKRHAHEIPLRFDYWELTVGLVEVDDQLNCGSCWVFPAVSTKYDLIFNFPKYNVIKL